jgi:hypothetical protein
MKLVQIVYCALILTLSLDAHPIVVRHDVEPHNYVLKQTPSFLVDMPNGGHGALIASNWVVTVAHLLSPDFVGKKIKIGKQQIEVEKVIRYPGVTEIPGSILTGDAADLMTFMMNAHDIALIKLSTKLPDNAPIKIYSGNKELGQIIEGYGRGTTGNGNTGSVNGTNGVLRQLQNRIDETHDNWLSITFDRGENALELEGIDGSWDSGGPLVIKSNGKKYLVGLFCWDYIEGNLEDFEAGYYGNKSYQVRLSSYAEWIRKTIIEN